MKQYGINIYLSVLIGIVFSIRIAAQELKHRSDYDLNGPVKKCTVLTSYGKEIYQFTTDGKLKQLISYFDAHNYQQISYTFKDGRVVERRIEFYDMGELEKSSSVINVYQYVDTPMLQKEIIADYNGYTLENITYSYDSLQRITSLKKLTNRGLSTLYYRRKIDSLGVHKTAIFADSILKKTIDSIPSTVLNSDAQTSVTTITYLDGFEDSAELKKYNDKGWVMYLKNDLYLTDSERWYTSKEEENFYNAKGQIIEKITKEGTTSFKQKFVYQTDGTNYENWVKKIVMPNMTYTTRIIEYYEEN